MGQRGQLSLDARFHLPSFLRFLQPAGFKRNAEAVMIPDDGEEEKEQLLLKGVISQSSHANRLIELMLATSYSS